MITAKFGGTAVTPRNLLCLKRIVSAQHNCVVVSAIGKEYHSDVKTTDLLGEYYKTQSPAVWEKIACKYRRMVEVNAINIDIDALLDDARSRATRFGYQYCLSLGEELSAKTVASFLNATYVDAEKIVRFEGDKLLVGATYSNAQQVFDGVKLGVVGGFYGGSADGNVRQTFSRGGSDVSGALFAAALNSALYENWTDVNGVYVANPTKVHGVATVDCLSYNEMRLLSLAGAEVLHPDAVAPVEERGIPIKIGNYLNPQGASTLISNSPSHNKLLSIAEKKVGSDIITTILHSYNDWQMADFLSEFFRCYSVDTYFFEKRYQTSTLQLRQVEFLPHLVKITTDRSILSRLYKSFVAHNNS